MKKYIAIICLLTLILTGCGTQTQETEPQATVSTTEATAPTAEQVVDTAESSLTGSWSATLNKGQFAAAIYYQSLDLSEDEANEKSAIFEKASYPLAVSLNLNEDGSYRFEVKPDDGTGFDAFVTSFTTIANENSIELTEDDARQMLLDARLDKLFLMGTVEEGTWEHNDQGLVLSGWCTIQFRQEAGNLHWDNTDDPEFAEDLPLSFKNTNE